MPAGTWYSFAAPRCHSDEGHAVPIAGLCAFGLNDCLSLPTPIRFNTSF